MGVLMCLLVATTMGLSPAGGALEANPVGTIVTIAGGNGSGYDGDGGLATDALLSYPLGLAVAADGTIYIVDGGNHAVRAIDPATDAISTIAGGNGIGGATDGPATDALLPSPKDVEVDDDGLVYVVDGGNAAIRVIDPTANTIATIAGGNGHGYDGDGGLATEAALRPTGVDIGPDGTIYIVDAGNHAIRAIDPVTGIITTVAGGNEPGYDGDGDLAIDATLTPADVDVASDGTMFIADFDNHVVRVVDPNTGLISTFAGGNGPGFPVDGVAASDATLTNPTAVLWARDGTVYIADGGNRVVRAVDPADGTITNIAGDPPGSDTGYRPGPEPALGAHLSGVRALALDHHWGLLVGEISYHAVRRVQLDPSAPFVDLPTNHRFFDEIVWMFDSGTSTGAPDGRGGIVYRPGAMVKRQAMAAFLYRIAGEPALEGFETPLFVDVPASHQFYDAIQWMGATGVSTGGPSPDGTGMGSPQAAGSPGTGRPSSFQVTFFKLIQRFHEPFGSIEL